MRDTVGVPVRSRTAVTDIAPAGELLAASFDDGAVRYARKIVLATGQDGMGEWWMPPFIAALPSSVALTRPTRSTSPPFRVAVSQCSAPAPPRWTTLPWRSRPAPRTSPSIAAGPTPQLVQPYRWLTFAGFLSHLSDLPDEWRWRFMSRILGLREGFPQPTWDRCARHSAFRLVTGAAWTAARVTDGAVELTTALGPAYADFVICGTGVEMDFARRPELRRMAGAIATWADRYTPPENERDDRLGRFPYLGPDYGLLPREPAEAEWIGNVHLFSIASTMSFGPSGSSINAMTTAVPKLVAGMTRGLFTADIGRHWETLQDYRVT